MPNSNQGGSHEQHVKAGEQSHKNEGGGQRQAQENKSSQGGGERGGTHEQHVKAGQQSHKNQ